jgi:hypothetical protein
MRPFHISVADEALASFFSSALISGECDGVLACMLLWGYMPLIVNGMCSCDTAYLLPRDGKSVMDRVEVPHFASEGSCFRRQ